MKELWKLDRFARNRYDSARYKAQLKKNGVKVVSATEIISEGAEGIILEEAFYQFQHNAFIDTVLGLAERSKPLASNLRRFCRNFIMNFSQFT